MTLNDAQQLAPIIGVVVAAVALVATAYQARLTAEQARIAAEQARLTAEQAEWGRRVNQAQFWLQLRQMLADLDEVHRNLRPEGLWDHGKGSSDEDMPKVEAYMGLLEHCKRMLDNELIDPETFTDIYRYRVKNILENPIIVKKKLCENKPGWVTFWTLIEALNLEAPDCESLGVKPSIRDLVRNR